MPVIRGISTSKYIAALFDLIIMTPIRTSSQLSIIINLIIYFCHLFELYNLYIHLRLWGDLIMVVHTQPINQVEQRGVYTTKCQWPGDVAMVDNEFVSDNNYFHPMNNLTARIASTSTSCRKKDVCDVDSRTTRRSSTKQNMPHATINHVEWRGTLQQCHE